eukprot:7109046-Lingulodinium_polyedra.AAC.1
MGAPGVAPPLGPLGALSLVRVEGPGEGSTGFAEGEDPELARIRRGDASPLGPPLPLGVQAEGPEQPAGHACAHTDPGQGLAQPGGLCLEGPSGVGGDGQGMAPTACLHCDGPHCPEPMPGHHRAPATPQGPGSRSPEGQEPPPSREERGSRLVQFCGPHAPVAGDGEWAEHRRRGQALCALGVLASRIRRPVGQVRPRCPCGSTAAQGSEAVAAP